MKVIKRIVGGLMALILIGIVGLVAWGWEDDRTLAELKPVYANEHSHFITLDNGMSVHLRDQGNPDGDVIVLIHGSSASLHTWEPWVGRLKDRFRLVSIDLAGHGLTGPSPVHDYSMAGQAALVDETLRKHGVPDGYTIVGSSMGGFVSWLHTLNYSDRVKRLVVIGSSGFPRDAAADGDRPFIYTLMSTPIIGDAMRKITPRSAVADTTRKVYNGNPDVVTDEVIDRYWNMLLREGNREATAIRNQQPRNMDAYKRLSDITQPTLVMWGEIDALVPFANAAKFEAALQRPTMAIYPDLGHIPFEEDPDRTVADLIQFIEQN